jgi:transcriptional regulator with XRE-family HTH domain
MSWDQHRVKELRQRLDLTQCEFAQLLGCRQQTVSEWEQGIYVPRNAYAKLLDQISLRSTVATRKTPTSLPHEPAPERMVPPSIQRPAAPVPLLEPIEYFSEEPRPFDPAID